ncbi:hypothetical protein IU498_06400 [Nocardia beijingensis]|uniref:hypothetical protein n=1 Tax=Nocardia beijingensis TaxID=95162 RepID=UPI0018950D92|nr:hypothetical protein [Nocardia beijingensis]MBF6074261.1 hypothetical protein [Nocardia beijingensis]
MRVSLEAIEADIVDQFGAHRQKFTVGDCPQIARWAAEFLGPAAELTDAALSKFVGDALAFAAGPRRDRHATPGDVGAAATLAGAMAYFYFDRRPTADELEAIAAACHRSVIDITSQECRLSWAKWQENRARGRRSDSAPHPRSGANQKAAYAGAFAAVLASVFARPGDFRAFLTRRGSDSSENAARLMRISAGYVDDIAVDDDLYVLRSIEADLLEELVTGRHPWPRVLVGEAGAGKSTLLWSVYRKISARAGVRALLLSASWVLQRDGAEFVPLLLSVFAEFESAGFEPILLLDTADLMLHDDAARQDLHGLMEALESRGFAALYSTRPQESALMRRDSLRYIELQPYDDAELCTATERLAERYCPTASVSALTERIGHANARWLPVADVCRSPLLLRMMFDLAAPEEPELDDVDVTRLFDAYWQRRIRRDARYESATGLRTTPMEDLSSIAGSAGVGLLVSGLPELPEDAFETNTGLCVGRTAPSSHRTPREAFDILLERGTLTRNGHLLGFFHQTMLEFAAAKGILQIGRPEILTIAARRAADEDGDLFVGAVVEQTLILAGRNSVYEAAAIDAVQVLLESESAAVRAIALVAWAHHREFISDAELRLRTVGGPALCRAVRILPSIAGRDVSGIVDQLTVVWRAVEDTTARVIVLESLARLGMRDPVRVARAVEDLDLVRVVIESDEEKLRRGLVAVLGTVAEAAREPVREAAVALVVSAGRAAHVEMEFLLTHWSVIGDKALYNSVVRASTDAQRADRDFVQGIGALQAAVWQRIDYWSSGDTWTEHLSRVLNPADDRGDLDVTARLVATRIYLTGLAAGDERIGTAVDAMLDAGEPRVVEALTTSVLPAVLGSGSASAVALEAAMRAALRTIGLAAQRAEITRRQAVVLEVLSRFQVVEGLLVRVLPKHLNHRDWTADPRLLRLAPVAADAGVGSALKLLEQMRSDSARFSERQRNEIFGTAAVHMPKTGEVFDVILAIALEAGRTSDVEKIVISSERYPHGMRRVAPAVFRYARELIAGGASSQRHGLSLLAALMRAVRLDIEWTELRTLLDTITEPTAIEPIISVLWNQNHLGGVADQVAYLSTFILVEPEASPPITRAVGRKDLPRSTAVVCCEALLRFLTIRFEAAEEHWPTVRTLGLHQFEDAGIHVPGTKFVVVCEYLARLGVTRNSRSAELLLDYLALLATGTFFGITEGLWRREFQNAVRVACGADSGRTAAALLELCTDLDDDLAAVIAETVAEQSYRNSKTGLHRLSRSDVSDGLRDFVLDLIRTYDRRLGTRAFPELLAVLSAA